MNLRIEIIKAQNGYIVQIADDQEQGIFIAGSDDDVKKIVSSTVLAYFNIVATNVSPGEEQEQPRQNRAPRRANRTTQG